MSHIDLMDTYKALLHTTGMEVTPEGFVRMEIDKGEYIPVTGKEGRMVVLPLTERLRDKKIIEQEVFHLLKDGGGKDSDLMSRYRHWLINRMNLVIGGLGGVLLDLAANPALTKRMSPEQQAYLGMVAEADKDSSDNWGKLADLAAKANQIQQVFVSVYLQPAAVLDINGQKQSFNRVARFNFPIFDELKNVMEEDQVYKDAPKTKKPTKPDGKVFGVPVRVKDREVFMGVMRYMLPELDVRFRYDVGSNSRISPGLDAMMRGVTPLAEHLNAIMELFTGLTTEADRAFAEMMIPLEWTQAFENLDVLWPQIRTIPTQATGVIDEPAPVDVRSVAPAHAATPAAPYGMPVAPPPWQAPQPPQPVVYGAPPPSYQTGYQMPPPHQRAGGNGQMDVGEMMRALGGGRPQPQQQYPQQGGYYQAPPPGYHQPGGYPPPAQRYY